VDIVAPEREKPGKSSARICDQHRVLEGRVVLTALVPAHLVRRPHHTTADDQRARDHPQGGERSVDERLGGEAHDHDRDGGVDDPPGELVVVVLPLLAVAQPPAPRGDDPHDVLEEVHQYGGDRADLDDR
jgi:hypothetical protein